MNFGSLFAGIGGIDLGLERAGMTCAWQVDNDDFCLKVLTKHWPDVPKYGDIRNVGKQNLETVDLIAGGFPCQPFSVAGKRRGTEDNRHLWPEMLRVISELKPAWVLGENVPGIIPLFLDQAISDLEAEGYKVRPIVFPACAFDAPHRRDRLFIIAYNESDLWGASRNERPISFDRGDSLVGNSEHTGQPTSQISRGTSQRSDKSTPGEDSASKSERPSLKQRVMADTEKERRRGGLGWGNGTLGNATGKSKQSGRGFANGCKKWWLPEPNVGRVAHGVPSRVDRLKSLGNAVVPQLAEFIGRIIMEANNNV